MAARIELYDDPAAFLRVAGDHLRRDPLVSTVVATVAEREAREGVDVAAGVPHWYAVSREETGAVTGAGMRTAPFPPYPLFVLGMPDDAAVALARLLHGRGEAVAGVNGVLPAARVLADETARLTGGEVVESVQTRLWELRTVVPPTPAPGRWRLADDGDLDLVESWFAVFGAESDAQAGRRQGMAEEVRPARADVERRVRSGLVGLREVDGQVVHLTAWNAPAFGAVRIGPVLTSREHRGRGHAAVAVADLAQRILDAGHRPCLFTDRANPVSTHVYTSVGFEPLVDMVNLRVGRTADAP